MVTGLLVAEWQWWGAPWPDALLAMSTAVLAIGVFIGVPTALLARRSVAEGARTRQTQLYVELSKRWESRTLREVRAEIAEMTPEQFQEHMRTLWRQPGEPQWQLHRRRQIQISALGNYFEDLGVLESLGSLDVQWIEESVGDVSVTYWKMWALYIQERRGKANSDLLFENWQCLAKKVEERRAQREGHHPVPGAKWHRRLHF